VTAKRIYERKGPDLSSASSVCTSSRQRQDGKRELLRSGSRHASFSE